MARKADNNDQCSFGDLDKAVAQQQLLVWQSALIRQ